MNQPHDNLTLLVHVIKEQPSWREEPYWRAIVFWWKSQKSQDYEGVTRFHYELENESPGNVFEWYDTFPKPPKEEGLFLYRGVVNGGGTDYWGEADDFYYEGDWHKITWSKAAMIALGKQVTL